MAGDVYTFDLQSMQMIGEQMRFLTTRVRNLQNTVDKATMAGGVFAGDRGRTQDHVQSVVIAAGEWLKDSNPNLIADIEADPAEGIAGGLPPYRIQGGYSVSAVAHVMGFNRKTGRQMGTGKKVRIFDPTGNSDLTAGDTAHVFWNRRSNHWEVLGSQSTAGPQMVPLELLEDAFIPIASTPQGYRRRTFIQADVLKIRFDEPSLRDMNQLTDDSTPTTSDSWHESNRDNIIMISEMEGYDESGYRQRHYVVDPQGTIPWATSGSRGYGIEMPKGSMGLAEDATDEVKEHWPTMKFYYPVFFEQRAMWFGFTAPREISAADRRVVVHESWIRDWHSSRIQGGGSASHQSSDVVYPLGNMQPELANYNGESPAPFLMPPNHGGLLEQVSETPDPAVAPSAAEDGINYPTDRENLLAYSTEVYNTFGFTVDQGAPCNAIWMGDRYVLIQAKCPVGIKDPTHGSAFDSQQPTGI